jgi:hypothetical protein
MKELFASPLLPPSPTVGKRVFGVMKTEYRHIEDYDEILQYWWGGGIER